MFHIAHHRETEEGIHIISFGTESNTVAGQQAISIFFGQEFMDWTEAGQKIIVDLSNVQTLDSLSLRPMVQRLRHLQQQQGRLILCGVSSPSLKEIFSLTRFDQVFEMASTVEDAIRNLTYGLNDTFDDWPG